MKVLVINCGSSSLKYQLIDMDGEKVLCKGLCERIGMESSTITHEANGNKATTPAIFPTHTEAFHELIKKMTTGAGKCIEDVGEINAIGHRIVHGGEKFQSSCVITDEVVDALRELSPLAPLHNPAGILGIETARKVFGPDVPQVAVFDTAFHSTMPPKAYMYAIPYEYYEKYGVRRYGFHGTSHKYVSRKAAEYLEEPIARLKLITCHLGNGSSITAGGPGPCGGYLHGHDPAGRPDDGHPLRRSGPLGGQLPEVYPGHHRPRAGPDPEQEVRPAGHLGRFQRYARRRKRPPARATTAPSWPLIC